MPNVSQGNFFNNKIITVNFILAISVMFIHSENIIHYKNIPNLISLIEYFISYSIGNLAVPTFFMMSSYLFYRNFCLDNLLYKYQRRVKSILLPYLIWNSLYFIIFYIITLFPGINLFMTTEHFIISPETIFESILFHKYNRTFWFLQQLIYFIILSPLIYHLLKRKWSVLFIGIIFVIGAFYPTIPNNQYGIRIYMIVYWLLGCYFAVHKPFLFEKKGKNSSSLISFFICLALLIARFVLEYVIQAPSHILSPLLLFFNTFFLWFALSPVVPSSPPRWMQISFFIYTTHPLLIDAWKKGSARILPNTPFFCLLNYIFAVIISFVIISIFAKCLLKFFPRLWNVLNGGRTP